MLRSQLDLLSQTAARTQADLQAASWRIAQLERELRDARTGQEQPSREHDELEQALVAAHEEIASLRRALQGDRSGVLRELVEQSVLLHQVAPVGGGEAATTDP
jgi:chromosome segregation ATPase